MNTIYVITATIKILFLVFFGKTFFSKNVGCSTKIILFFIFLGYGITNLCNMPSWTKCAIPDTRENNKTCFANQKILLGAIEMYNMDVPNDQKIKTLDNEAIINKLVEKNYLNKKNFNKSKEDCVFLSKGDLTKDGFVFCKKHGNDKDKKEKTFDFFIKIDSWVGKIVSIILYPIELLLEKDSAFSTVLAISIAFLGLIQASWGNFDASIKYYCSGIVYFIIILLIYFFFIKRDDE